MPAKRYVYDNVQRVTLEMFGVDAAEAVRHDPDRYSLGEIVQERTEKRAVYDPPGSDRLRR